MFPFFIIDLLSTSVSEDEINLLTHPYVGGVLLFSRNYENVAQLKTLVSTLRHINPNLMLFVDHEGGVVQRFQRHGFTTLPSAESYGVAFDLHPETGLALAKHYGQTMAHELLACGIDVSFAPVLDVKGISPILGGLNRAFHPEPHVVTLLGKAFIQGMRDAGMPSVGKHFPGHGHVKLDSHGAICHLHVSKKTLQERDLKPFMQLIQEQWLDAIMPAHVIYDNVDANHAAGYSSLWLQTILREELGFGGIVISDCLGMVGADIGDMPTRARAAMAAGCDLLIVCNQTRDSLIEVFDQTYQQTQASCDRLMTFKQHLRGASLFETIQPQERIETPQPISHSVGINNTLSV